MASFVPPYSIIARPIIPNIAYKYAVLYSNSHRLSRNPDRNQACTFVEREGGPSVSKGPCPVLSSSLHLGIRQCHLAAAAVAACEREWVVPVAKKYTGEEESTREGDQQKGFFNKF